MICRYNKPWQRARAHSLAGKHWMPRAYKEDLNVCSIQVFCENLWCCDSIYITNGVSSNGNESLRMIFLEKILVLTCISHKSMFCDNKKHGAWWNLTLTSSLQACSFIWNEKRTLWNSKWDCRKLYPVVRTYSHAL